MPKTTLSKATQTALSDAVDRHTKTLKSFPSTPTGKTTDAARSTTEWRAAKASFDQAFRELRDFNAEYVKAGRPA